MMKNYGLIGESLSHSFSKKYFTDKFDNEDVKACYLNFELSNISEIQNVFSKQDLFGVNVTIPYKEAIIPFLDKLSIEAAEIGAVNTVEFKGDETIGHNTDVFGFSQLIKPFFKPHHERAMIIGTGGAAKAVAYVLEKLGVDIIFISRNPSGENEFSYSDINGMMLEFNKMIVNTTPVGMYPNIDEKVAIPYEFITPNHLVVDLIYNPEETQFLMHSKEKGAQTLNGLTMLKQQAEKSWEIWNEIR
jgi:shikimate dehydrogenase